MPWGGLTVAETIALFKLVIQPGAVVYQNGTKVIAQDKDGTVLAEGTKGTDDATVIQAALTNVSTGVVVVREGTYLLAAKLRITGKSNFVLLGQGTGTIFKRPNGASYAASPNVGVYYPMLEVDACTDTMVSGIQLDGNAANNSAQSADGANINLLFYGNTKCTAEDMYIHDARGDEVNFYNCTDCTLRQSKVINYQNTWICFGTGASGGQKSQNIVVSDCYMQDGDHTVELFGKVTRMVFDNCRFYQNYAAAHINVIKDTIDLTIRGCSFEWVGGSNGGQAVLFNNTASGSVLKNCRIIDCDIYNVGIGESFDFRNTNGGTIQDVLIQGCYFWQNSQYDIILSTFSGIRIIGNVFASVCSQYHIFIGSAAAVDKVQIANNRFLGAATGDIRTLNIGTQIEIHHNIIANAALSIQGGEKIHDNMGYQSHTFKASTNVAVGLNNAYGAITSVAPIASRIAWWNAAITIGGTVGAETITVRIEVEYEDGTLTTLTKTYTATSAKIYLTAAEIEGLISNNKTIYKLRLSAKTDQVSTLATVTVDSYGSA